MLQNAQAYGKLPQGYTALEYIQSSGAQYIDTGRKLTQNSDITIDFMIVGTKNRYAGILGSHESASKNSLTLSQDGGWSYFDGNFSDRTECHFTTALSLERTKIRMNKTGVWVNDILIKSWSNVADFKTPTNGLIFNIGNNNWLGNKAIMRLYSYKNGNVQHLVPCLDTDGVPCMYDLIRRQTLYNQGTGSFTWG